MLVQWPNLEQIATELFFMAKYSENIPGISEKSLQKYKWGNIFKTPFEVGFPFNTFWFISSWYLSNLFS